MPRSSLRTVEETEMRLLSYVVESARGRRSVALSMKSMAKGLGVSEGRVSFARDRLVKEGCLEALPRYSEDGGRLANAYRVTPKGRSRLRSHLRKQRGNGGDGQDPAVSGRGASNRSEQ